MKVCFIVNRRDELVPSMTTMMLIRSAQALGHRVLVACVDELYVAEGRVFAEAVQTGDDWTPDQRRRPVRIDLESLDLVVMRTNPARDPRKGVHAAALTITAMAAARGLRVVNHADGLRRAGDKLYLETLPPEMRPATWVTADPGRVVDLVMEAGLVRVAKPLAGTRGQDVFLLDARHPENLRQIAEVVTREGYAMVQAFAPKGHEGDTRVVVLDGEPVSLGGQALAIRRVPGGKDFRSNIHAGGRAQPGEVTAPMRATIEHLAPRLREDGIRLAGFDFVGDLVVEVNVFSNGGFRDAERFHKRSFSDFVVTRLLEAA